MVVKSDTVLMDWASSVNEVREDFGARAVFDSEMGVMAYFIVSSPLAVISTADIPYPSAKPLSTFDTLGM